MNSAILKRVNKKRSDKIFPAVPGGRTSFHFKRQRLHDLFMEAVRYPLVLVCAGAGYGKTSAVQDFTHDYQADTVWIQLSERDNVGGRFWENYTNTMSKAGEPYVRAVSELSFPDTNEKLNQFMALTRNHAGMMRQIIVMDDFHCINDPAVIRFIERAFLNLPPGSSLFLISRSTPHINTAGLISRGHVFSVSEEELRFSGSELAQYFRQLEINLSPDSLREIMQDTGGWAFAINLIARSYRKAPGYGGYLRDAMKANVFRLMESEIWSEISGRLQNFLVRLSLIGHLSVDLIALLAGKNAELIDEMERQNAYVRRDSYINAYLIHPLFLEFMATKQHLLSEEQKRETYTVAGNWCNKNGFKIDALSYYEKIGDYKSISGLFVGSQAQIPYDIACYMEALLERTPPEVFDREPYLVWVHIRSVMCQGRWEDSIKLSGHYEARYKNLPEDDQFRKHTLRSIYFCCGISRALIGLSDDVYDFDLYYEKLDKSYPEPFDPGELINKDLEGPWLCAVGASRKGAPEDYLAALKRSTAFLEHCYINFERGINELAFGELLFYKYEINAAEGYVLRALDIAREKKLFGFAQRALFYLLRIAISQGNYEKADQAVNEIKANLDKAKYTYRFIDCDIFLCWYYCAIGLPESVPDWLKENFSPYAHASWVENFANQMKARFHYQTRNYPPLLSYIQEMKQRESYLFGRVEMLAMEACVYYKMKNKKKACSVLLEAYGTASPNNILTPFVELGRDMRTLTAFALNENIPDIPKSWLEFVNRKSASYAKRCAHVSAEYKQSKGMADSILLSPREKEILVDLTHGFTRTEIAISHGISINTVKMVINNIYSKMGAESLADAIRIAAGRKVI